MDNKIIFEPAAKIREIGRQALSGRWKEMYVGMFIYYILISVVNMILDQFFTYVDYIMLADGNYYAVEITYASSIYSFVVYGALTCGMAMFTLAFFRTKKVDYGLLFEGFSTFGKCFWLYLLYSVKIALWSMLFAIPGIIAAFRYSQAFFLRVDHPDWTAGMCIRESSRIMKGNKAKYFGLQISFIGWYILSIIPVTIMAFFQMSDMMWIAAVIIGSIPVIVVDLYVNVTNTAFYELLTGNLIVVKEQENSDVF